LLCALLPTPSNTEEASSKLIVVSFRAAAGCLTRRLALVWLADRGFSSRDPRRPGFIRELSSPTQDSRRRPAATFSSRRWVARRLWRGDCFRRSAPLLVRNWLRRFLVVDFSSSPRLCPRRLGTLVARSATTGNCPRIIVADSGFASAIRGDFFSFRPRLSPPRRDCYRRESLCTVCWT